MQSQFIFWTVVAALAVIDAILAHIQSIKITVGAPALIGFCVLAGANLIYSRVRLRPRIAALALSGMQLVSFLASVAVLSYLTAALDFPLIDQHLAAVDRALGFDWLAVFEWVKLHPVIDDALNLAYLSFAPQLFVLLIVLSAVDRSREFVAIFSLTLLIVVALSAIMPAAGAWAFYGVENQTSNFYLPDFIALRTDTLREIELTKTSGIVQFPSFHAAFGLIVILATRGIRFVFPVAAVWNAIMIFSALTHGGHHLSDVLAGLAIALCVATYLRTYDSNGAAARARRSDADAGIVA